MTRGLPKVTAVWSLRHCKCLSPGCGEANGSVKDQDMVGFLPFGLFFFFAPEDQAALFL